MEGAVFINIKRSENIFYINKLSIKRASLLTNIAFNISF